MIQFEGFSYRYPGAACEALHDVTFMLDAGSFALACGPSGTGKSTLLRAINGLTPHFSGGVCSGRVRVAGLDPIALGPAAMSAHVGFVFQDPESQFVLDTVEDEIAFALENAALAHRQMRVRVEEAVDLLDIAALRARRIDTLSGGERQRVAIAAALALRPDVLVLDEPTSQLDPKSAEDVLQALIRLNTELGLTVVISEHRIERLLPFVDHCLVFASHAGAGQVRSVSVREAMRSYDAPPPLIALARKYDWQPLPLTAKEARRFIAKGGAARSTRPKPPPAADLAVIEHLSVDYDGRAALRDVTLRLGAGQITAVLGRNGSGKSTLLRAIVGLVKCTTGLIRLDGAVLNGRSTAEICRTVCYLPQDPNALLFAETVREELAITLRNHGLAPDDSRIDAQLAELGLDGKADAYPRDLSTGERQRVALASVAIVGPRLMLLDEPTRGLDPASKQALIKMLRARRAAGVAIVVVTHDVEFAGALADRAALLSQGELLLEGPAVDVLGSSPYFATLVARLWPGAGALTVEDLEFGPAPAGGNSST